MFGKKELTSTNIVLVFLLFVAYKAYLKILTSENVPDFLRCRMYYNLCNKMNCTNIPP